LFQTPPNKLPLPRSGTFASARHATPVVQGSGNAFVITLTLPTPATIDRLVVAEDIRLGQLVRAFEVLAAPGHGFSAVLAAGASIGVKFIAVLQSNVSVASLTLNVTAVAAATGTRHIANFVRTPATPHRRGCGGPRSCRRAAAAPRALCR